jgi:hypothetical protein
VTLEDRMERKLPFAGAAVLLAVLVLASPAPAQEAATHEEMHEQMIGLFGTVELRLRQIDKLLYDAAAGEARLASAPENPISSLLKTGAARSREVIEGIDKILELARNHQHPSGGT